MSGERRYFDPSVGYQHLRELSARSIGGKYRGPSECRAARRCRSLRSRGGGIALGGYRSSRPSETINQVRAFCGRFRSLPFDEASAEEYGRIRADLASLGKPIGPNDLMIAAIALANRLTLVTNNTAEFGRAYPA